MAELSQDQRKPWEKTSWTCALARVDHEGMHCPDNKCPDCPKRSTGVNASDKPRCSACGLGPCVGTNFAPSDAHCQQSARGVNASDNKEPA